MALDPGDFIRSHTEILCPPLIPEIRLHTASEISPIWEATEADLEKLGLPPPFWAFAWAGGQGLARYLLDTPDIVAGKQVFDFASGSGICAIAAALAGAAHVVANEIDPYAGAAIALNAALNGVAVEILLEDVLGHDAGAGWDVVLAGDVCYEKPMADRMTAWLRRHASAGALVLLGDPGRTYRPDDGLTQLAEYSVPTSRDLEDSDIRRTVVWRVLPFTQS